MIHTGGTESESPWEEENLRWSVRYSLKMEYGDVD